jgi:hypothetical protein
VGGRGAVSNKIVGWVWLAGELANMLVSLSAAEDLASSFWPHSSQRAMTYHHEANKFIVQWSISIEYVGGVWWDSGAIATNQSTASSSPHLLIASNFSIVSLPPKFAAVSHSLTDEALADALSDPTSHDGELFVFTVQKASFRLGSDSPFEPLWCFVVVIVFYFYFYFCPLIVYLHPRAKLWLTLSRKQGSLAPRLVW